MKLKSLIVENFGTFSTYQVDFPAEDKPFMLLTGRNNAGKSTIIRALKLLQSAMNLADGSSKTINRELLKRDTVDIQVDRMIHNYEGGLATIIGILDSGREVEVQLDSVRNRISCHLPPYTKSVYAKMFGFIPPLGQLAETEKLLDRKHIIQSIDTTLAPRHLRNHFYHLFSKDEFTLLKKIIGESWEGIELGDVELDQETAILCCLYKEGGHFREIAWGGQGLQIWIQILTHMIRLSATATLVLDEPEIFLHPQKQHDLIEVLRTYYGGSIIMATHSPELMSSVDISHIANIRKDSSKSKMHAAWDRKVLEQIRSYVGSNFNLIASQFEDVELLLATENETDYKIVAKLASEFKMQKRAQNVPIGGFQRYKDCYLYRDAYKTFFGKEPDCSLLLDSDYYPQIYLHEIQSELSKHKVRVVFTPGKEIENLFLEQEFLRSLIPSGETHKLDAFLDEMYKSEYDNCFARYVDFHAKYTCREKALTTTILDFKPIFDSKWNEKTTRHNFIAGKGALAKVRTFFKQEYNLSLPTNELVHQLVLWNKSLSTKKLILQLYGMDR